MTQSNFHFWLHVFPCCFLWCVWLSEAFRAVFWCASCLLLLITCSSGVEAILIGMWILACMILLKINRKAGDKRVFMELVNLPRHFQCLALSFNQLQQVRSSADLGRCQSIGIYALKVIHLYIVKFLIGFVQLFFFAPYLIC